MSVERMEELSALMARESIKYRQIQTYFQSLPERFRFRNPREVQEVINQLQESAMVLGRFRDEYNELMKELQDI